MTRRPDPFNKHTLEKNLLEQGCPESCLSSTISNYRLFVPLLFAELGEERVFQLLNNARADLGLGEQESAWRSSVKHIVTWAEDAIEQYKARRDRSPQPPTDEEKGPQPRLL
ncbi:MAG: hypothetical protein JXJ20_12305 [Anaerolineae bacterium]|jgi:hypothetical protein|nr:hypothetical protein [Anaerolineae bacterium]